MPRHTNLKRAKRIIELKDKHGLSFSEIGKILGLFKQETHRTYHREKSRISKEVRR